MNGERSAASAIRQVISSWAAEQNGRDEEVNQIKRHFGFNLDELNRIGKNMGVIANELNQDFSGTWYQCNSCSAHNLNNVCKGCGSTDMDQLSITRK